MKLSVKELFRQGEQYLEQEVVVEGWVRSNRNQKEFGFLSINDGTFFECLQIVYGKELANFEEISKYRVGSSVTVTGVVVKSPNAKQPFEIKATSVLLEGDAPEDYPIQPKRHTREFLREKAHLRMRTNLFSAVFRMRSKLAFAIHEFFQKRNFVYVNTPLITSNDGEGAGEMFQVTTLDLEKIAKGGKIDYSKDFFGKPVNLTVTGQLEAETYALAFGKVYTFGPTFRAENSNTTRHASEFWMIEPEIAFADLEDDMALIEDMIKYCISTVLEECPAEMEFFNKMIDTTLIERLTHVLNSKFEVMTYTSAIETLKKAVEEGHQFENKNIEWGMDLNSEHEKYLCETIVKGPLFLIDYPKEIKSFYMKQNADGKTVAACDLLVPGIGELVGGSQREERLDYLERMMDEKGMEKEGLQWYLDLRRYGGVMHSGFGVGFERLVMYMTGISNIRDVLPYPRTPRNLKF